MKKNIDLSKKKILITGGNGFLGSYLVKRLIETRNVKEKNIFIPRSKSYDLRIMKNCESVVKGRDVVIHLAANVGGIGLNREKPGELFYDNLIMGTQLMEASRKEGIEKFVSIGTVCAYPKYTPVPFKEDDLWNGYPEETNAAYGLAKKMQLVQSQAYRQQYGFNAIYLLPVNLYGPGDNFDIKSSHVIPALIRKVVEAKQKKKAYIAVWGSGKASREFLYVEDAAEGIILATEKYNKPEPVNIGSGMEITIKKLAKLICKQAAYKGDIHWDMTKPDGQPKRNLDVSRAKKEFGFEAKFDFQTGLKNTLEWYMENSRAQ